MAKTKGPNKVTKNVFKVAGSRTLRIKSKTQKLSINLKKLELNSKNSNKEKTNKSDKLLAELRKEVHQAKSKKQLEILEKQPKNAMNFKLIKPPPKMEIEATAGLVKDLTI